MIRFALIILCSLFISASHVHADDTTKPNFTSFASWPVLHDGRIKTFESLARSSLYQMAGQTSVDGMDAIQWLAVTLFDPSIAVKLPVIRVEKQNMIELPSRDSRYYSLNEMMVAMRPIEDMVMAMQMVDASKLSASQKEILTVYGAMVTYTQLVQSLGAVLPLSGFEGSYMDGAGAAPQRALIAAAGGDNILLRFIPDDTNPSLPLISIWEAVLQGNDTPILNDVKDMAIAWNDGDYNQWNEISSKVADTLKSHNKSSFALTLESYYVSVDPIFWAMAAYIFGALIIIKFPMAGLLSICLGGVLQAGGMIARSIILMRPPTGTIYETFLFASLIIIVAAGFLYCKNRNELVLAGCVASAAFLLFISRGFIGGDSLNVLVAVLNTNFWLSTHVTCIIIGYALCVMAAVMGHLYLATNHRSIQKLMVPLALIALLFTSIGTLLGGIWADQSWGRFWGWDPKENGALLITIWLIWVLHGRISGHFNMRAFAAALGLTNITVALTWFGVNLLGVGLHSYGFMAGIAYGLTAFCVAQTIIIIGLYFWHRQRHHHA
jgi:ABC-type transport system involved in cytochrome c biogenesis permease subunit